MLDMLRAGGVLHLLKEVLVDEARNERDDRDHEITDGRIAKRRSMKSSY